jgi:hypothetical protein
MATPTETGVKIEIEVWYDLATRTITFSSNDGDLGPKGMIGSFRPGSAAENRARELLAKYSRLPDVFHLLAARAPGWAAMTLTLSPGMPGPAARRAGPARRQPGRAAAGLGRHVRADLPGGGSGPAQVERLAGDHAAEPEPLVIEGQMPHQPQACPPRRQHWPPQVVLGEAVKNPEHMIALMTQR